MSAGRFQSWRAKIVQDPNRADYRQLIIWYSNPYGVPILRTNDNVTIRSNSFPFLDGKYNLSLVRDWSSYTDQIPNPFALYTTYSTEITQEMQELLNTLISSGEYAGQYIGTRATDDIYFYKSLTGKPTNPTRVIGKTSEGEDEYQRPIDDSSDLTDSNFGDLWLILIIGIIGWLIFKQTKE
jgi:hypothetical protein